MNIAITVTISKLGPSGSLKSEKSIFENTIEPMAKVINEVFLGLRCMSNLCGPYRLVLNCEEMKGGVFLRSIEVT